MMVEGGKRKNPFWINYIKNRIKNKKNFLGFISGATGSGKSWTGLSICNMLDPSFTPERIITNMKQLMKLVNSDKLNYGNAILWDEAGIDISSKSWQSLTNKLVNFLMQTFRHKRFILIFTSPYMDFVDASTRKLFHAEFQMERINQEECVAKVKPFIIQYNGRTRKFYYKYLRARTKQRGIVPIKMWTIPKPPNWLIEEYEQIKTSFTSKLNQDIEKQLEELETKGKKDVKRKLTDLQKQVLELMAKFNDTKKVSKELGLTERTVYFHINQARKKNWDIKDFLPEKGGRVENATEI
jgi:ABC-type dipeptide/oligopeptide/nickel transport system ATPase component